MSPLCGVLNIIFHVLFLDVYSAALDASRFRAVNQRV